MNTLLVRYRWLRLAFFCCAGLCLLFVYDAHREPPEMRRFRALGIPPGPAAVVAEQPPFREAGNGAVLLMRAAEALTPLDGDARDLLPYTGRVRPAWGEALEEEQLDALRAYVAQNTVALDLLYEAQRQDFFRFPDAWYTSIDRPQQARLRDVMILARCAALEAALAGDREAFERRVTAALRIPDQVEPVLVRDDDLSRWMFTQTIDVLELGLHYIAPGREVLELWLSLLEQGRHASLAPRREVYRNETALFSAYFSNNFFAEDYNLQWKEQRRSGSRRRPATYTIVAHPMAPFERQLSRWRGEWTQEDFFNDHAYLATMGHLIGYAHWEPYRVALLADFGPFNEDWFRNRRAYTGLLLMPAYLNGYRNAVKAIAQSEAARTALAALLYQEDHGRLPDMLEDLVPDYLDAVPRDPYTAGDVIRYALHDDSAVFYSMGGSRPGYSSMFFRLPLPLPEPPLENRNIL